jgi:hypothetical protein
MRGGIGAANGFESSSIPRSEAPFRQPSGQLATRPVQPSLHRSHRAIANLRNLGQAQLLVVVQHETDPVLLSQTGQSQFEFLRQVLIRAGALIGQLTDHPILQIPGTAQGQGGPAPVDRDPQDPRLQWTLLIESRQSAERPDQGFLSDIFRILTMRQDALGDGQNERLEAAHEFPHRPGVPREAEVDQDQLAPLGRNGRIEGWIHRQTKKQEGEIET